ncbi:MAG TPA: Gfo/Idh/MocA family oxidoreductase [Candidatus Hydrogenedentes bacterium]|nr:Gfo/Idh/MocA family oxidoreductase [Candidatus Hydrogenedentota bacterium]HPG69778.1 Gfo/Idh/MocA family oxidoreductase [Candidatus Hydrogenedentota bacterium]
MKKIRVAIIGQGRSGRDIHGAYLSQDTKRFTIVAVVDPIRERRERAAIEYGCNVYRDHRALLKRTDLDLIVNATPSMLHVPVSLECLRAGFNVLCEKPLASKTQDVDALIAASQKANKVLAIFQQSRFAPYFRQVRKVIDSGVLGDIVQVSIAFNGFSRRYDWQTLTEFMGGSLLNTGPHPLDQALQLFGTDRMPDVKCYLRNANSYGNAEDHVMLILSGEGRPLIDLEISSCCAYPCYTYNVYGTRGGLKGSTAAMEWRYYDAKDAPKMRLHRKPISKPDGTPSYCVDSLTWHQRSWKVPVKKGDLFSAMSGQYYSMVYRTLTTGAALEITPEQVRQQIAVIQECHRQNPHIWRS